MTLPYEETALEPNISAKTVSFHYGKHHAGCVNKLNGLVGGTTYENRPLEHVVKYADGAIFNNAAQVFNHDFYWDGLSGLIERDFGSMGAFKKAFLAESAGLFGSGW